MEMFWIVVYAYVAIVVFSIAIGMMKCKAKEFWTFLTEISDCLIKGWNENHSSPKTFQSNFRV